jgi:7 transmembrane receptor (Secretin family)/GPCR proteolysis site, GPS, motif
MKPSYSVGIRFPKSAIEDFKKLNATIAYGFFKADSPLFRNCSLTTNIVSATHSSGQMQPLDGPVVIWLKRNASHEPGKRATSQIESFFHHVLCPTDGCVSWDLNAPDGECGWSKKGCTQNNSHPLDEWTVLDECHCTHLTHFSQLLLARPSSSNRHNDSTELPGEDDGPLEAISTVCCSVALACLSVVLAAAILNKKMLQNPGQKIRVQLVANLALLLSLYLLAFLLGQGQPEMVCKVLGLAIVYALSANAAWMALAGYLQYMRLVKVFHVRTSHFILKSAILGWALPLLPVLVLLGFLEDFTGPPLCMPSGNVFYGVVLAPLCLVLVSNLVIFALIVKNLFVDFKPRCTVKKSVSVMRFKQLGFMFTLFSLNWFSAVFQNFPLQPLWRLVFAYVFSISVALQGISYLVFFVLLHESVKHKAQKLFCNTNQTDSTNVPTNSSELYQTTSNTTIAR